MAHIHNNEKGFLIIRTETLEEALNFGGLAICDGCNKASYTGYYISVLNYWYCDKCFNDWYKRAKRYAEDIDIEERNYKRTLKLFNP